jgi:D-glycerate 3-kinase
MAEMTGRDAAGLLGDAIAARSGGEELPLIGLNGAQGSGKSTMAKEAERQLAERCLRLAVLSLDDFYLTRAERRELARCIHPLCATRGVPGTHDAALMRRTIDALAGAEPDEVTRLPVFDKLADDRLPRSEWSRFRGRPDAVLLEGWCVGLLSEDLPPWQEPINALERELDADGRWAAWSHAALERNYDDLWQSFAMLASIEVPDLETVISSRLRQEMELAEKTGRTGMDREAVTRFVQHYERQTRALWAAMPRRADLLLRRDADYRYTLVKGEMNE